MQFFIYIIKVLFSLLSLILLLTLYDTLRATSEVSLSATSEVAKPLVLRNVEVSLTCGDLLITLLPVEILFIVSLAVSFSWIGSSCLAKDTFFLAMLSVVFGS